MTTAKAILAQEIPEAELMGAISVAARINGWLVYHTHDSRRSEAGFPDLVMVRDGELLAAELKSQRGKVTDAQQRWLDQLATVPGCEAYLWRPSDLDVIHQRLSTRRTTPSGVCPIAERE